MENAMHGYDCSEEYLSAIIKHQYACIIRGKGNINFTLIIVVQRV